MGILISIKTILSDNGVCSWISAAFSVYLASFQALLQLSHGNEVVIELMK